MDVHCGPRFLMSSLIHHGHKGQALVFLVVLAATVTLARCFFSAESKLFGARREL